MIRILLAAEAPLFRGGLAALLNEMPDLSVVGAIENGRKVVPVSLEYGPDVALIDVALPDLDGFAVARELRREVPRCRSVLMAARRRPGDLRRAAEAGAVGFLLTDISPEALTGAIRRAARGERVIDADLAFTELSAVRSPLTERELEVLGLAAEGASAEQIARTLVLTIGTVRNHLSRINRKVGARNRVHAIRIAEQSGWL